MKGVRRISKKEQAEFEASLKQEAEKREKEQRRLYEPTEETVGKCSVCQGNVIKRTEWENAVPISEVRMGATNPMRPVVTCSCAACGRLYNADFFKK